MSDHMELRPPESGLLTAIGKDGQKSVYEYFCDEDTHRTDDSDEPKTKWSFYINEHGDIFNFDLVDEGNFMRVEMVNRNGCDIYEKKGIPDAFIRLSHQIFNIPIHSSSKARAIINPNGIGQANEQLSDDAEAVWLRLVAKKEASYDESAMHYSHPPKSDWYEASYENAALFQEIKNAYENETLDESAPEYRAKVNTYIQLELSNNIEIVHGLVGPSPETGKTIPHAWFEIGSRIFETQDERSDPYTLNKYIEIYGPINETARYTVAEATDMVNKHSGYGNWAAQELA